MGRRKHAKTAVRSSPRSRDAASRDEAGDDTGQEGLAPHAAHGDLASSGTHRQRWIVLAVICLGVLIPLRYYLGDDPYDERFSWRMFSSIRVQACRSQLTVTSDEGESHVVRVQADLHQAWLSAVERNRASVIEKLLERQCDAPHIEQVTLTNQCQDAQRSAIAPLTWQRSCKSGLISRPEFSE